MKRVLIFAACMCANAFASDFDSLKAQADAYRAQQKELARRPDPAQSNQSILNAARTVANKGYGGLNGSIVPEYGYDGIITQVEFLTRKNWHCRIQRMGGKVICINRETFEEQPTFVWNWIGRD